MYNLDTLEDARNAEQFISNPESDEIYETQGGEWYAVLPLRQTDDDGSLIAEGTTLWLHVRGRWQWDFFSYKSDCWAWVTDRKRGGNRVNVDRLEAKLKHSQCYGDQSVTRRNVSSAHAFVRNNGVGVCKSSIRVRGCAEKTGYPRWCTRWVRV